MYVSMTSMRPVLVVAWSYWSQTPALAWSVEDVPPFQWEIFPSKDKEQSEVEGALCCSRGCGFVVVLTCVEYLEAVHVLGGEVVFG